MSLPKITLATSVRYGSYKTHCVNAFSLIDVVTDNYRDIEQYITLPEDLSINFRPVRNAYGKAFYTKSVLFPNTKEYIVEVDVRQDLDTFKHTLLHELVHIEQFYQGRLKDAGSTHFKWKGKKMLVDTSSMDAYNKLPWEVEANTRAELLMHIIFAK